VLPDSHAIV